jgi:hypothetical protein
MTRARNGNKMSIQNDKLHQQALDILAQMKPTSDERNAKSTVADYDERRRQATMQFGEVASQIWEALERGESVGGAKGKEEWCAIAGKKIRWVQTAIARWRGAGAVSAPPDDASIHPLSVSIDGFDFSSEEARVELEVSEWRDMPGRRAYSVLGDLTIMVEAQDVPLKMEMPCPLCDHDRMTVREDGTYGDHITNVKEARGILAKYAEKPRANEYCRMSGELVRGNIAKRYLVAQLYKKMEKTLRSMRLWNDALKQEFDEAVKDETEAQKHGKERRSDAAKRGAQTRRENIIQRPIRPASVPTPKSVELECLSENA